MTLLRRAPRAVYRVYSEEDYLNGAGAELASIDQWPAALEPARQGFGERRLRRVAGVTMLAGAVGLVGGAVVLNDPWAHRGAGRGPEKLVAAMHSRVVMRSPAVAAVREAPSRPVMVRRAKPTRSLVRSRRRRAGSDSRALDHALTHLSARPRGSGAIVVDYVPRSSSSGSPAVGAPAEGDTTATARTDEGAAASAPTADVTARSESGSGSESRSGAGAGNQAEFGFER
jgi:hypothetical protein